MKRPSFYLVLFILVALIGISIYILRSKSNLSTLDNEARDFGFKDTSLITKIFLADKEGAQSTLSRTKDGWLVNGKYKCRSEAILNLLEVIKHVEVKMPVSKSAKKNVIKFMSSNAIKVEIYAGDEKVKQYYVGHEPTDSDGSYMILTNLEEDENFPDPYVCFIPGFKGILQPRFITKENEWRDRLVLNFIPPQIKQIRLWHSKPLLDSSFVIDVLSTSNFQLKNAQSKIIDYDMARMRQYLVYFQNISYEVLISGKNLKLQDSLSHTAPFAELTVVTTNNTTHHYRFYRKRFSGTINPELGTKFEFDPDRCYMQFENGKEWALVQYFVFGKLIIPYSYFLPPITVKK